MSNPAVSMNSEQIKEERAYVTGVQALLWGRPLAESLQTHGASLRVGGSHLNYPRHFGELKTAADKFVNTPKTVVVVGGGDTALEDALYLAKITHRVYLVHRRDAFRGSRILQQRVMVEPKIEILFDTVVTEILSNEAGVYAVSLKNVKTDQRKEQPTDGIFIFAGFSPNNRLVPAGVKVNQGGYVITDEKCETSLPGIFAVGDLRQKYANQIVIAAADGCTAALAAAHYVETKKAAVLCQTPAGALG